MVRSGTSAGGSRSRGLAGLADAPHPGRPRVYGRDLRERILATTLTQPEGTTHYKRNGTISLFAALEVGTGAVTHETHARHTGTDFLALLRRLARTYPRGEVHVVLDNVSTHKTPVVQRWLGGRPRFTFHFTPTSASWMNQVETWFGILTRQAIRRGTFESTQALTAAIERFTREWNAGATPFSWVKTADQILAKAVRKPQDYSGARH